MELDALLTTFDKVAANLKKLERVWERASPLLPTGPWSGSTPEYQTLAHQWNDLLQGLLPVDGWVITDGLPDMDELGRMFLDYAELGELPTGAWELSNKPSEDLAEYHYRLDRARRRAIAARLAVLTDRITELVQRVTAGLPTREEWLIDGSAPRGARIDSPAAQSVELAIAEIERLLGDSVERKGRWGDMRRHLRFSETQDWLDIADLDWPSVQRDIEAAQIGESDPIPVPDLDLGAAAGSNPTGGATTVLNWMVLDPDHFERLLFDLLRDLEGYQNVQWLMNTNAPDRGRDISLERVVHDASGLTRTERVIVQAKHFTSKAVGPGDVAASLSRLSLWEPPAVRTLIIATSGRFSADAVGVAERHNENARPPYIELWPDNRLEILLTQRPALVATYRLRT